jgi:leucyl/phenylalanyl-tRNA--protein transferase
LFDFVSRHLAPARFLGAPGTLAMMARHYAGLQRGDLPDPERALRSPDGLCGICNDLNVPVLVAAYAKGLFPFSCVGPQKWWAPRERMVLFLENAYISNALRRLIRTGRFAVTFDTDFTAVVEACAEPRPGRANIAQIGPDLIAAYRALHEAGYAHSVEVRDRSGRLAGGLYGIAVGKVFFTEAMFARARNASKVGFATLSCHLQQWGFALNDGKRMSGHLSQLGFTLIPRQAFNRLLAEACGEPGRDGPWTIDQDLDISRWNPKAPRCPKSSRGRGFHSTVVELS